MSLSEQPRDHGGDLDHAIARFGGAPADWLDLSTGINPHPYPISALPPSLWTRLPDATALRALEEAARRFWQVPAGAAVLAAPGASALIAQIPRLGAGRVWIPQPTYNEHAAAFRRQDWQVETETRCDARVLVHPNNPDGRLYTAQDIGSDLTVIDESFCDVCPDLSLVAQAMHPDTVILKSFGKFWGLAGLRLGFAIAHPDTIALLREMLGPWPVSGPALHIGRAALSDNAWADATRHRLARDRQRLDRVMRTSGAHCAGGTDLFGLYRVDVASDWQDRLAKHQVWSRIFPYDSGLIRLGLPPEDRWPQLEAAV